MPALLLLRFVLGAIAVAKAAAAPKPWKQWTCDQLTPNLCDDLTVETGSLVVRSVPVRYWRYRRRGRGDTSLSPDNAAAAAAAADYDDDHASVLSDPIVVLHGGPSWPHSYLLPLRQLACRGAEVIFYDQAGCGKSTLERGAPVPPADHPHLLDPSYYSEEELPALLEHWGLDRYHVLGHSWGTILAQNFALDAKNTSGLQSLILSGPLSDSRSYIAAQWDPRGGNLASLPPFVQGRIKSLEERGAYDDPEYEALDEVLGTFFTLRTAPAPDCFTHSAEGLNKEVYVGMQGASEFTISGVLGDWNVTGRLQEIDVPVLLTHGAFDTMRPSIVKTMEEQLRLSERVMLPHSGHVSMIDDAGMMNDAVADFLRRVEKASASDEVEVFVPRTGTGDVDDVVDNLSMWAKLLMTFVAGLVIGRMLGCSGNGYTRM